MDQSSLNQPRRPITRNRKLTDPGERDRILGQYAGIFPYAIKQFAEVSQRKIYRPRRNFAK